MTNPNVILAVGDKVFMGSFNPFVNVFGVMSDLDTPDMVSWSMEGFGGNGMLTCPVIKGDKGDRGDNAPLGYRQFPVLDSVDDLPTNLTNDPVDIGKYWIVRVFDVDANEIGSNWAMWNGTDWEYYKEGEPGQAGPVPIVTPVFQLVTSTVGWSPTDAANGYRITKTGNDYTPTWTIEIYQEVLRGPAGSGSAWSLYTAGGEAVDDVPIWNGAAYVPAPVQRITPQFFTYPEGHFTSFPVAIGTSVPIGTALIPPIDHDVVPYVQGHFRLTGIEADTTPFIIGVEVRLGSTSGQVVARGYGNITGYVNLQPHASTASLPNDAITPDNGRAVIPANSTGAASTLYVNAYNDGAAGEYSFDATGAQLSALMIPV